MIFDAREWKRFTSIKRGYYSAFVFLTLVVLSFFLEVLVSNRAVIVVHQGRWFFPSYGAEIPGEVFGLGYSYEANYRELKTDFKLMPLVPYSPTEIDSSSGEYHPLPPDFSRRHFLGTDVVGRDVLARLAYGFRSAVFFATALLVLEYLIGILLGTAMGYWGGWFDMGMQRLIEIWINVPFLYAVIILASILQPQVWSLMLILLLFSWPNMTWYLRTSTYRERERTYVLAARVGGASSWRIMTKHILPNTLAVILSFAPFTFTSGMMALVSLDFLGFGLPPNEPSLGELLKQGLDRLDAQWILGSVMVLMISVLCMVTFVGEAMREVFDPKSHSFYR